MTVISLEDYQREKLTTEFTFCVNCKNFQNERGSDSKWDQLCVADAVTRPEGIDFVTGKAVYISVNDLGGVVNAGEPYPYAADINTDGHCPHFSAK